MAYIPSWLRGYGTPPTQQPSNYQYYTGTSGSYTPPKPPAPNFFSSLGRAFRPIGAAFGNTFGNAFDNVTFNPQVPRQLRPPVTYNPWQRQQTAGAPQYRPPTVAPTPLDRLRSQYTYLQNRERFNPAPAESWNPPGNPYNYVYTTEPFNPAPAESWNPPTTGNAYYYTPPAPRAGGGGGGGGGYVSRYPRFGGSGNQPQWYMNMISWRI